MMSLETIDLIAWVHYLKRAAHKMIVEDDILKKATPLFRRCEAMAKKMDGDLCDGGSFTVMTELFCNCLCHQFGQVEYVFLEIMPSMSPKWKLHREIWLFRFLMYQRFQVGEAKIKQLCDQLENRIQSGKILTMPSRIYEHWLLPED